MKRKERKIKYSLWDRHSHTLREREGGGGGRRRERESSLQDLYTEFLLKDWGLY